MEKHQADIQGLVIVVRGHFNPIIFSPVWFSSEGLIRKEEAAKAETQIVNPDVVSFNLDWLRLQVTRETFFVETTKDSYEDVLRDLVAGTFKLLRHTPLTMMGINRHLHFRTESVEKWHQIGDILAPKKIWNDIFNKPGLKSLSIVESDRDDGLNGHIQLKIEPSARVNPGLFISTNDHFQVNDAESALGADEILDILENRWQESLERSTNIVNKLLENLDAEIATD